MFTFIKTLGQKGSSFSQHIKDAMFMIPSSAMLARIVAGIDQLDMQDRDTQGDLYEYLLSKVATGEYLRDHHHDELFFDEQQKQHFDQEMFHGFDMDSTMLRIGAMNMLLHGVDNPQISYRDSLSTQNVDQDKYTLVLANPLH